MGEYKTAVENLNEARNRKAELERSFQEQLGELEREIDECRRLIEAAEVNCDANSLEFASKLLSIRWAPEVLNGHLNVTWEVRQAVSDAVEDARAGFEKLSRRYFGVKSYARWSSQREDHEYGLVPAYGSLWFRVELSPEYRRELTARPATEEEMCAVVYALERLLDEEQVRRVLVA